MMIRNPRELRLSIAMLALLSLAGCASYIDAKREVANAPAAMRAAEVRRDAAIDQAPNRREGAAPTAIPEPVVI